MALWRVAATWSGPSSPLISQFFFDVGGGGTPQQAATAVSTMLAAVDGFISSAYSWSLDAEVRQINEATGQLQSVIPITGATGTGAAAGPRLDLLQGLVTWQTPDVADGRNVKGRFFVPGPTEDHNNTQGRPEVSGYVGGIQPFVNTFITDSSSELNVWHRPVKDAGGNITREGSQHEVLSALVEDHWAYLSSRRL